MNEYLKNLNRIEFVVTLACTGRCKHCQNGDPVHTTEHIDADAAVRAIQSICKHYKIETLMTFGGEPLLFPDVVFAIHKAGTDMGIPRRQVITNGYISKQHERIEAVVQRLAACGVNDLLLSVDAFHQETIPLEPVLDFAECALRSRIPIELSPAWLVSREDQNPYNIRTREVIEAFTPLHIPVGQGNVIFPSGNALKYLKEYFDENTTASSPYEEDPRDIRSLSFSANGDVLDSNVYQTDILDIIRTYKITE
ncbi:MAG: radical SAM protein [Clostridiales bacterium]|nr:radical SAM protein [Clostridiales bacterium]